MTAVQKSLWPDDVLTNPDEVTKVYNDSSNTYGQDVIQDGWNSSFVLLRSELQKIFSAKNVVPSSYQWNVLDAGCANGLLGDKVDFKKYGVDLHGIDIAKNLLDIAKNKGTYKELHQASFGDSIPYDREVFDTVIANGVLGYCATNRPIYEFLRILKPGGHILISMRSHHFEERGYNNALVDLSNQCKVIRQEVFSAFPNNPNFKHEYQFIVIEKFI